MTAPVVQVTNNAERNYTINVVGIGDTVGATIIDVSAITADSMGSPTALKLMQVQGDTDATIKLAWAGTPDKVFEVLAPGQSNKDYFSIGGLTNDASTPTGDVLIPAPAGAANYSLTLWFVKKYA